MESSSITVIATAVLSVVSLFLGAKYRKWLDRGRLFAKLLDDIVSAAEDDKISEEEFQKLVADVKKVAAEVGE
jgi:hypothetical protein